MSEPLSRNAQAILLLTAPLRVGGRSRVIDDILTPAEYRRLAQHLRLLQKEPADLIRPETGALLEACRAVVDHDRLKRLLERGFQLSQAVEHWQSRAIWVVSRADAEYPRGLKARLKDNAPALLYGCGDRELLGGGGIAVVGSRHVDDGVLDYASDIGALAARAGRPLISGGARGIDQAAMGGALEAGGHVVGILADRLERAVTNRDNRNRLLNGRLALVSPYDPGAGFNVGHAMQRNKLIYALADVALVVSAEVGKGGTWAGATEQLDSLRLSPVYVRDSESPGLKALVGKGARLWPAPETPEALDQIVAQAIRQGPDTEQQSELALGADIPISESPAKLEVIAEDAEAPAYTPCRSDLPIATNGHLEDPARMLLQAVRPLLIHLTQQPQSSKDVAESLAITQRQAEDWLNALTEEGDLQKLRKPVRFVARQEDLFET